MTDFSPLDSALYESTPEKIAASLRYLRKTDAVMAALMPLSASTMIVTLNRLQWSKTTLTPKRINQHEALKLCEGLSLDGHSDWRLPTRAELLTLVDDTRHEPAIDTALFPDTKPNWYWTSTVCAWSSARAWFVDFDDGLCGSGSRDYDGGLVRAVRSLPPGQ